MKPEMLKSQFAALEEPRNVLTVDIDSSPPTIARSIRTALGI
jgi:gluconate kinase